MKRESIIVIIVSTVLNLGWSLVFDLLPNFVDLSSVNKSFIEPINYLLLVLGFVVINLFVVLLVRWLMKKVWRRETRIKLIEEAINKQITNEVDELPNNPPQILPGENRPVFYHYTDAINQLSKNNGWIEFEVEGKIPDFDDDQPIYLCDVNPGMFKYFMVIIQDLDVEKGISPYCRIKSDPWGTSPEFTEDWYNTLFAIFSSFSEFVSPKMHGPGRDLNTHYVISEYKFKKRGKNNYLLIRIV